MRPSSLNEGVLKRNAVAYWMAEPRNRPVKLTNALREPAFWTEGYVTCYKFVAGRTLAEAEKLLGLPIGELRGGAYLFEFQRLPREDEFGLRGYTQCPDGKPWTPESAYPPGAGVAQWQVHRNTFVPSRLVSFVGPGEVIR
jgi:hypothetical protein